MHLIVCFYLLLISSKDNSVGSTSKFTDPLVQRFEIHCVGLETFWEIYWFIVKVPSKNWFLLLIFNLYLITCKSYQYSIWTSCKKDWKIIEQRLILSAWIFERPICVYARRKTIYFYPALLKINFWHTSCGWICMRFLCILLIDFFIPLISIWRVPSNMHDISGQRCQSTDSFAPFTDNSSHHSMSLCVFALALACEHWSLFIMQSTKIFIFYTIQYTVDFDYEFIRFIIYFK